MIEIGRVCERDYERLERDTKLAMRETKRMSKR